MMRKPRSLKSLTGSNAAVLSLSAMVKRTVPSMGSSTLVRIMVGPRYLLDIYGKGSRL
jgi:hypothetical protein